MTTFIPLSVITSKDSQPLSGRGEALIGPSRPRWPALHILEQRESVHMFLVEGSRLFEIDQRHHAQLLEVLESADPQVLARCLNGWGLADPPARPAPASPPIHALSLAVAQSCNLSCSYCYAQQGGFGAPAKVMTLETAVSAVDLLLANGQLGDRFNLAFLGGEPLINRPVLQAVTEYAARQATDRGLTLTFSLTTNATLLTQQDAEFFERYGFAATISVDGIGAVHDRLRRTKSGRSTYDTTIARAKLLLDRQQKMQVSARVTVTPENLFLRETLDELVALGFYSVGFSPMLSAPSGHGEMQTEHLVAMLDQLISCGEEFFRRLALGLRYPFANLVTAMQELHRGSCRSYPCGAGAGYYGVSAEEGLYACHRFVGDEAARMGDVATGVRPELQAAWLDQRHVNRQEPCQSCWARYLCGGGCHHEVIHRGRPACDFIRGWLHYCLLSYMRLQKICPKWFAQSGPAEARVEPI